MDKSIKVYENVDSDNYQRILPAEMWEWFESNDDFVSVHTITRTVEILPRDEFDRRKEAFDGQKQTAK